jgi:hypothetical protein
MYNIKKLILARDLLKKRKFLRSCQKEKYFKFYSYLNNKNLLFSYTKNLASHINKHMTTH